VLNEAAVYLAHIQPPRNAGDEAVLSSLLERRTELQKRLSACAALQLGPALSVEIRD
jgi:hypothetical protein